MAHLQCQCLVLKRQRIAVHHGIWGYILDDLQEALDSSKFLIVPEATLCSLEREVSEFIPAKGLQKHVEQLLVAISRIRFDVGGDAFEDDESRAPSPAQGRVVDLSATTTGTRDCEDADVAVDVTLAPRASGLPRGPSRGGSPLAVPVADGSMTDLQPPDVVAASDWGTGRVAADLSTGRSPASRRGTAPLLAVATSSLSSTDKVAGGTEAAAPPRLTCEPVVGRLQAAGGSEGAAAATRSRPPRAPPDGGKDTALKVPQIDQSIRVALRGAVLSPARGRAADSNTQYVGTSIPTVVAVDLCAASEGVEAPREVSQGGSPHEVPAANGSVTFLHLADVVAASDGGSGRAAADFSAGLSPAFRRGSASLLAVAASGLSSTAPNEVAGGMEVAAPPRPTSESELRRVQAAGGSVTERAAAAARSRPTRPPPGGGKSTALKVPQIDHFVGVAPRGAVPPPARGRAMDSNSQYVGMSNLTAVAVDLRMASVEAEAPREASQGGSFHVDPAANGSVTFSHLADVVAAPDWGSGRVAADFHACGPPASRRGPAFLQTETNVGELSATPALVSSQGGDGMARSAQPLTPPRSTRGRETRGQASRTGALPPTPLPASDDMSVRQSDCTRVDLGKRSSSHRQEASGRKRRKKNVDTQRQSSLLEPVGGKRSRTPSRRNSVPPPSQPPEKKKPPPGASFDWAAWGSTTRQRQDGAVDTAAPSSSGSNSKVDVKGCASSTHPYTSRLALQPPTLVDSNSSSLAPSTPAGTNPGASTGSVTSVSNSGNSPLVISGSSSTRKRPLSSPAGYPSCRGRSRGRVVSGNPLNCSSSSSSSCRVVQQNIVDNKDNKPILEPRTDGDITQSTSFGNASDRNLTPPALAVEDQLDPSIAELISLFNSSLDLSPEPSVEEMARRFLESLPVFAVRAETHVEPSAPPSLCSTGVAAGRLGVAPRRAGLVAPPPTLRPPPPHVGEWAGTRLDDTLTSAGVAAGTVLPPDAPSTLDGRPSNAASADDDAQRAEDGSEVDSEAGSEEDPAQEPWELPLEGPPDVEDAPNLLGGSQAPAFSSPSSVDPQTARQRPDAIVVDWKTPQISILEFTRPYDRSMECILRTDEAKRRRYQLLLDAFLSFLPPPWKGQILTFTVGVKGTIREQDWIRQLCALSIPDPHHKKIMAGVVSNALDGALSIIQARQAHLQNASTATAAGSSPSPPSASANARSDRPPQL